LTAFYVQVTVPVLFFVALMYVGYLISRLPENDDPHRKEQYRFVIMQNACDASFNEVNDIALVFSVPYMPYPPLIGILVNYFLVAQLVRINALIFLITVNVYFGRNGGGLL
jgi:hypothetical protein